MNLFAAAMIFVGYSVIATAAVANPLCATLFQLAKVEDAAVGFKRATSPEERHSALDNLDTALEEIGPYDLAHRHLDEDRPAVEHYIETRRAIVSLYRSRGFRDALGTATSKPYADARDWLAIKRRETGCNLKPIIERETDNSESRGILSGRALGMLESVAHYAAAGFLALVFGAVGRSKLKQWNYVKKRRSKRVHCRRDVILRSGEDEHRVTIHDASQNGTKIAVSHDFQTGEAVAIRVMGAWVPGKVRWVTSHFIGVEFNRRLRKVELFTLSRSRRRFGGRSE